MSNNVSIELPETSYEGTMAHGLASIIDAVIGVVLMIFIGFAIESIFGVKHSYGTEIFIVYYLIKDIVLKNRSIGKRIASCYVVEKSSGRQCLWWQHLLRIFVSLLLGLFEAILKTFKLIKVIFHFTYGDRVSGYQAFIQYCSFVWGTHAVGFVFLNEGEYNELMSRIQ